MDWIKTYIISEDTIIAIILSALCIYFMPDCIGGELIKDLLGMGIGVLSIIFSIFFAALAFIISASDNDFVNYLEEDNIFTDIITTFKWTVFSLFIALLYSIIIYVIASFKMSENKTFMMSEYILAVFCFLFFYSLIATMMSTKDAIRYSHARIDFANKMKPKNEQQQQE